MSDSDKIHILCDKNSLSDKKYKVLGIPEIHVASVESFCGEDFPSPVALANTWDLDLVDAVSGNLFKSMAEQNVDLATVPGPKLKISPYRSALSEDPFLAKELSVRLMKSAEKSGVSTAMQGLSLSADETEWIEDAPDARFIQEYIVKPYTDAMAETKCAAVVTETDFASETYGSINSTLMNTAKVLGGALPICEKLRTQNTVQQIANGALCFEGSAMSLESALSRYKQLKKGIEHGTVTAEDLSLEIVNGRAISPDMLDLAVDRLLDFAFSVKRKPIPSTIEADAELGLKAQRRSVVLLKNEGILPMKRGAKLCIVGDLAFQPNDAGDTLVSLLEDSLSAKGFTVIGADEGYDLERDRSEELLTPAEELIQKSDIALLFLGLGEHREKRAAKLGKISIPANQQHLLDRLQEQKKKVIAILPPELCPDVGLPENCSAILLSPLGTKYSAQALSEILSGEISPSGRLASTVYCHTEELYQRYKTNRVRDGMKTGPFIGYRYYDTAGDPHPFPFGHGLSYTSFSYSKLTVSHDTVTFTVTNKGSVAGIETAQIYVGMNNSQILRPKKELCGFVQIQLQPGEKKTVQVPLILPKVYNEKTKTFVEEAGNYTVYVGASVTDVRLMQSIRAGNDTLEPDGNRISDYIQSRSNIITDNFKLEAKIDTMKKSIFNYIAGAVAFVLAIVLKMYCAYAGLSAAFFDIFAIALGVAGLVFFITEAIRRHRIHSEERKTVDEVSREGFSDAENVPVYSADQLFVKEFDTAEEEANGAVEEAAEGVDAEYLSYIDKEQNFASAAHDFEVFAAERGCKFKKETVMNIFSSLSASRLIVVSGMSSANFKKFMLVLSSYFETVAHIDHVDKSYEGSGRVLFQTDDSGNKNKTNVLSAIESARNIKHSIHFAALDNVYPANLPTYFTSFVNYVKNPFGNSHVTVLNDANAETSYYIPQNIWFVLNLSKDAKPDELPTFVAEVASVNSFDFAECDSTSKHAMVRKFSYYQLDYLCEKASASSAIDEESWKKIDKLEELVSKRADFVIGNKMWLCLEKYTYAYLACGGEAFDALDRAVSAKLMPALIAALRGKMTSDERSLSETVEMILGEDRADACKKLIKDCGADVA